MDPVNQQSRRQALRQLLWGGGGLALRALATGIPASLLRRPRQALAAGNSCLLAPGQRQYLILSTSAAGDPINCNVPGTYLSDPDLLHPTNLPTAALQVGSRSVVAAAPWATLPTAALQRLCFFHHATQTVVHANQPRVMNLMGRVSAREMLVSALAQALQACLGTVQAAPIALGGSALEALTVRGLPQPLLRPSDLVATLAPPSGPLGSLRNLRNSTLDGLARMLKQDGTPAQAAQIDQYVQSQAELTALSGSLMARLSGLKDDGIAGQIAAAGILVQMKVAPIVTVSIPFGGDSHADANLAREVATLGSGVATLSSLVNSLAAAKLTDTATFALYNVFGRTMSLALKGYQGRDHNGEHSVGLIMGKHVAPGVVGGVERVGKDWGAASIDPGTGQVGGSITRGASLAAFGATLGRALGLPGALVDQVVVRGTPVQAALRLSV